MNPATTMTKSLILVVDDDVSFGELTCRRLERLDYQAKLHPGSRGVLTELLDPRVAAVILDVKMPGLTGPELMQMIRTSLNRQMKVLFYSSADTSELRALALEHGADGYLNKSASLKELEIRLQELLGVRRSLV
jgi:DNA-binding response OmpR family regulator